MERERTGFEEYVWVCCRRENKVYKASYNDPLAQICEECKADKLVKECIAAIDTLNGRRLLQVVRAFSRRSKGMEVKGYRVQSDPKEFSLCDGDKILAYIEAIERAEVVVVERVKGDKVILHFFVRKDGEQLEFSLEGGTV